VDVPRAQIWTYGYNADVIGGVFQANNKNSISQHGQDLSVRLEREIGNSVGRSLYLLNVWFLIALQNPIAFVVHSLGGVILKDVLTH
jgi:hypothetical protein